MMSPIPCFNRELVSLRYHRHAAKLYVAYPCMYPVQYCSATSAAANSHGAAKQMTISNSGAGFDILRETLQAGCEPKPT